MSTSRRSLPSADDIDLATLGAALWQAKGWILGLAVLAGVITFVGLSMMRPLYTSEARILVQNEESAFTRPTADEGRAAYRTSLDEQAVQSQVQVLTSRDLILQVVRDLNLVHNPVFERDAGRSLLKRILIGIGLSERPPSQEERAANALADRLNVFQLAKSSVIAVEYSSGDPQLAAEIANKLADVYIGWQRTAKIEQTKDATAWLEEQIKALRKATTESEEAVEAFKASEGLYAGTNNVTLNAQQLSELNSQLILAEAQESEARARAKLIKQMLADNGDIDATPEVLKSQLIINLIEQRVEVQRQLAELSATLLPSHPRIQQLRSELADVRAQIRDEAGKIVKSLENEAQVASAREASLRASLNAAKSKSAGASDAEIKLRALEREAKANRDLLESYLARYRDASARHDMGAAPAQATIVSRAHASLQPSFPRKGPITLLVMAATILLALAYTIAGELIQGSSAPVGAGRSARPHRRTTRMQPPAHDDGLDNAPNPAPGGGSSIPGVRRRKRAHEPATHDPATHEPATSEPAAQAQPTPDRKLPVVIPQAPAAPQAEDATGRPTARRAKKPAKRPSWLKVNETREPAASTPPEPPAEPERETWSEPDTETWDDQRAHAQASEGHAEPAWTDDDAKTIELLNRLKANAASEDTRSENAWFGRIRGVGRKDRSASLASHSTSKGMEMASLSPNDLRHYLTQRIAAEEPETELASRMRGTKPEDEGPVLDSLDVVLNEVLEIAAGGLPRALLVAGTSAKADATHAAIALARDLVDLNEQVVLVDLTKGASAVSGPLGMPRVPGFTDLAAGRATFSDVIRITDDSPLHVITAGNPVTRGSDPEPDAFMRVFEALTQAYGCVVLHADLAAVQALMPALKFELPAMVAVLPARGGMDNERAALTTFKALGCPVLLYRGSGKARRSGLLGRIAAI